MPLDGATCGLMENHGSFYFFAKIISSKWKEFCHCMIFSLCVIMKRHLVYKTDIKWSSLLLCCDSLWSLQLLTPFVLAFTFQGLKLILTIDFPMGLRRITPSWFSHTATVGSKWCISWWSFASSSAIFMLLMHLLFSWAIFALTLLGHSVWNYPKKLYDTCKATFLFSLLFELFLPLKNPFRTLIMCYLINSMRL